jgi:hypothetical protein
MTKIRYLHQCLVALGMGIAAAASGVFAQEAQQPTVSSQLQRAEATVKAIDQETRQVTLQGPRGALSFKADPSFKNLNKVQVGDKVVVTYYEGVATRLAKGGTTMRAPATSTFNVPATGGAPGRMTGSSVTATVRVEAINLMDNTVAFKGSDGQLRVTAVRTPDMQQFIRTLKPGDLVEVTYTESIAVNVEPATRSHVAEGK